MGDLDGDGVPEARGWVFDAATGELRFVEDDAGQQTVPISSDVNADGVVTVADLGMVIDDTGANDTTRSDVNTDGFIDGGDALLVVNDLGATSASFGELNCVETGLNCPCDDPTLDDDMRLILGCDIEDGGGGGGGGGGNPVPPGPDWDGFDKCMNGGGGCREQAADRVRSLETWRVRRTAICFASSVAGGFGAFFLFKKNGAKVAPSLFAAWTAEFLLEWEDKLLDHHNK